MATAKTYTSITDLNCDEDYLFVSALTRNYHIFMRGGENCFIWTVLYLSSY